jgi:hypothetical protein
VASRLIPLEDAHRGVLLSLCERLIVHGRASLSLEIWNNLIARLLPFSRWPRQRASLTGPSFQRRPRPRFRLKPIASDGVVLNQAAQARV